MILGNKAVGRNVYNRYIAYTLNYTLVEEKFLFSGFLIVFYNKNGYVKYKYTATSGFRLINEMIFTINENGTDKAKIKMLYSPEELGFTLRHNDFIEIYLFDPKTPLWSGVVNKLNYEYKEDKFFEFECIGFSNRLKNILINKTYNNENINNIIIDLFQAIIEKDTRYSYKAPTAPALLIGQLKFDNKKANEALLQLQDILGDYKFIVYGDRELKYIPLDTSTKMTIFCDNKNVKINKLESSSLDKIKNIVIVERKANNTSGMVNANYSYGSSNDNVYALNGIIKVQDSINNYGEYLQKLQIPESVSDETAVKYGIQYAILNAYPKYSLEFEIPFYMLNEALLPKGFITFYGQEKTYIELINDCEDTTGWGISGSNLTLTRVNNALYGRYCLKIEGNANINDFFFLSLDKKIESGKLKQFSFWINSNKNVKLDIILKDSNNNMIQRTINTNLSNKYELIRILCVNNFDIETIIFKFPQAYNQVIIYIDTLEAMITTRKKYDLELKEVEYILNSKEWKVKVTAGTIEKPFIDKFVEVYRVVETLKLANKGA